MNAKRKSRPSGTLTVLAVLLCTTIGLTVGPSRGQDARLDDWNVDPVRGPVDLGLTDPSLVGAIDVHLHVDPDAPGTGGVIRAVDVFDATRIAMARGTMGRSAQITMLHHPPYMICDVM